MNRFYFLSEKILILKKQKHKQGSAVQRFGDWRKGEFTVLIDNQKWLDLGKPISVEVNVRYNDKV